MIELSDGTWHEGSAQKALKEHTRMQKRSLKMAIQVLGRALVRRCVDILLWQDGHPPQISKTSQTRCLNADLCWKLSPH